MPLLNTFTGAKEGTQNQGDQDIRNLVLGSMLSAAPMLNYARWFSHAGNAVMLPVALPNSNKRMEIRDLNTDVAATIPPPPAYITTGLRIFTAKTRSDRAWEAQNTGQLGPYHSSNLQKDVFSLGRDFTDRFINDNPAAPPADARRWIGLKELCSIVPPAPEYALAGSAGGNRTVQFTENGGILALDDTNAAKKAARRFLELCRQVDRQTISSGAGTKVIFMPDDLAFRLSGLGLPYLTVTRTDELLNQPTEIGTFMGYPVVRTGKASDLATDIIPLNETVGSNSDCTSMYIVTFNEQADLTFSTNIGVTVDGALTKDNFLETRVELQAGLTLANPQAIARIEGIRLYA